MTKTEREIKKRLVNEYTDINPSSTLRNRVFNNLGISSEKKKKTFFFSRRSATLMTTFACLLIIVVVSLIFILSPQPKEGPKYQAIVQVDVNPSIEMTVDEKGNVSSIRGLNDEGKMIIADEELVSKNINEVLNIIVSEELETGYLNEESSDNEIVLSICAENETIDALVKTELNNCLNEIKTAKNLDLSINYNSGKTIESIKEFLNQIYQIGRAHV